MNVVNYLKKKPLKERIDYLHQNNLKINVWTVDDPEIGEKLSEMKVDFITTNRLE